MKKEIGKDRHVSDIREKHKQIKQTKKNDINYTYRRQIKAEKMEQILIMIVSILHDS